MNSLLKIKIIFSVLALMGTYTFVFAQSSAMLAYNDGLATVTVSSGITITIQGGYTSQRKSGVDGQIDNQGTINISGDFINNNTASEAFSTSSGTINLNSATVGQIIDGTFAPGFYNLTLNNTYTVSPQITLNVSSTVKNSLTMTLGNVNLNSHTLTLGTAVGCSRNTCLYGRIALWRHLHALV